MHVDNLPNSKGEFYPKTGEIDLMKYYHSKDANGNFIAGSNSLRTVASEKDLFGLIWLTKIKIL